MSALCLDGKYRRSLIDPLEIFIDFLKDIFKENVGKYEVAPCYDCFVHQFPARLSGLEKLSTIHSTSRPSCR